MGYELPGRAHSGYEPEAQTEDREAYLKSNIAPTLEALDAKEVANEPVPL